jgi:hypothetical protein
MRGHTSPRWLQFLPAYETLLPAPGPLQPFAGAARTGLAMRDQSGSRAESREAAANWHRFAHCAPVGSWISTARSWKELLVLLAAELIDPDCHVPIAGRILPRRQSPLPLRFRTPGASWSLLSSVRPGARQVLRLERRAPAPSAGSLSIPAELTPMPGLTAIDNANPAQGLPGRESLTCHTVNLGYGKKSQQIPDSGRQCTSDLYGCTFCPFVRVSPGTGSDKQPAIDITSPQCAGSSYVNSKAPHGSNSPATVIRRQ